MRHSLSAVWLMAALLISFVLTGCVTSKPVAPDYCATAKPIYISSTDVISDATAREILEHNETGRNLCGWGRAKK